MKRRRFVLIVFVLLGFGLFLAVPAEDVPGTAYDESEGVPYLGTPMFSSVGPAAWARIAKAELSRDSLPHFEFLIKRCKRCRESNVQTHRNPGFLTILNHSLRC